MSKTEKLSFQGICKWNDLYIPNKFNKYEIILYPNPESLERIRALNLKNTIHKDEDGEWIRFSRPLSKQIRGKEVAFAPPIVTDSNNYVVKDVMVGHGSSVTVTVDHYTHKIPFAPPGAPLGHACRLEGVRIDNLVPYTKDNLEGKQREVAEELEKQPPQIMWR